MDIWSKYLWWRFALWCIAVLSLICILILLLGRGISIETDIMSLLPHSERDPVVKRATRIFSEHFQRRVIYVLGHSDSKYAKSAASLLNSQLSQDPTVAAMVFTASNKELDAFWSFYFPHRERLISEPMLQLLAQDRHGFLASIKQKLYRPLSATLSANLEADPLMFFASFIESLPRPMGLFTQDGDMLVAQHRGLNYVLLSVELTGAPFSRSFQKQWADTAHRVETEVRKQYPEIAIQSMGLIRFASHATNSAQREISTIGLGSLLGIILLLLFAFWSVRPLLLSLLSIGVGLLAAFSLTALVFPSIHIIALVLGSSLIGVCIDYSFHAFSEWRYAASPSDSSRGIRSIFRAITLGTITSIIGYLVLYLTPFPGLQQMAFFSSIGLAASYLTVVCTYPVLLPYPYMHSRSLALRIAQSWLHHCHSWSHSKWTWLVLAGLLILSAIGIYRIKPNDDIRLLQRPDQALLAEQRHISELLGNSEISRFILVEGKLQEDVLIKEEIFLKELRKLQHRGIIAQAIAISDFVPSRHRQEQKLALLRSAFLSDQQILEAWMRDIGFETQVYQNLMQRLQHSNPQWLTTEEWLSHPVSANLRHLWLGQTSRGYASIIILQGVTSEAPIAQIAQNHNGVHYIDTVRQITGLFQRQRQWATYFVIAAYLCILALLWMLSGLKLALLAMLPPVVAALFVLGIYGLLGLSFHLFHFLALLLVLGIGIDYGIFFAQPTLRRETTMLAVTLSAITSMLAFGLLSLSQTPALRAFGLTILLGIGLAWLISPLVSAQTSCKSQ